MQNIKIFAMKNNNLEPCDNKLRLYKIVLLILFFIQIYSQKIFFINPSKVLLNSFC